MEYDKKKHAGKHIDNVEKQPLKIYYTNKQKMNRLIEKNPAIKKMQEQFGLQVLL